MPYRVDRDESAEVLIDTIEKMITSSEVCIAEITTDNPNVWYELGYAFAKNKKVIMLCSDERGNAGFFLSMSDIGNILTYATKAPSDFEILKTRLKQRLMGMFSDTLGLHLSELEKLLLKYIYNSLGTPNEVVPKKK